VGADEGRIEGNGVGTGAGKGVGMGVGCGDGNKCTTSTTVIVADMCGPQVFTSEVVSKVTVRLDDEVA